MTSPGRRLRSAVATEIPLQVTGTINALCALLAERAGFRAIYLSGAGVANGSFGLPDLGVTTLQNVLEDTRRITAVTDLPLLVDVDTGWVDDNFGTALSVARTTRGIVDAGAAGMQIEDQVDYKRCGHRPGKVLVETREMVERIKGAVDARIDDQFVIMARTDAAAGEGVQGAIERAGRYVDAGADMIFAEELTELAQFQAFTAAIPVPVLANVTEFGQTPLFTVDELRECGVGLVLYPLSAFRGMNAAAEAVYKTLRQEGTQKNLIDSMQTRDELYDILDYHEHEKKMDQLLETETNE
jgi:methylisocitrate lyase